ncbi:MAG: hypothetical protein JWO82_88, partial [Akkermansiaceae bacterium]|nr:hypothetical protein [Akkermansiaceae bacterium]
MTRSLILALTSLSLSFAPLHAEDAKGLAVPFPGLKTLVIDGGDAPLPEQISYDAALSKLVNEPLKPKGAKDDSEPEITRLLSTRLNRESETRHFIDFDPGPSADPSFTVTDEKTGQPVGQISADALIVPGNGFIYAMGRTDNMHLVRQKFAVREGKLVEIEQPFLYVGLDSKAKVPLTLSAKKGGGEVIASIPAGDGL